MGVSNLKPYFVPLCGNLGNGKRKHPLNLSFVIHNIAVICCCFSPALPEKSLSRTTILTFSSVHFSVHPSVHISIRIRWRVRRRRKSRDEEEENEILWNPTLWNWFCSSMIPNNRCRRHLYCTAWCSSIHQHLLSYKLGTEQANESRIQANEQMDKRAARFLHLDSWLFWTILRWNNLSICRLDLQNDFARLHHLHVMRQFTVSSR